MQSQDTPADAESACITTRLLSYYHLFLYAAIVVSPIHPSRTPSYVGAGAAMYSLTLLMVLPSTSYDVAASSLPPYIVSCRTITHSLYAVVAVSVYAWPTNTLAAV